MRSLFVPLLLALVGFAFLVSQTLPPKTTSDPSSGSGSEQSSEALLFGRLLGESLEPLASTAVQGLLVEDATQHSFALETDAEGRFTLSRFAQHGPEFELRLWVRDARGSVSSFANLEVELAQLKEREIGDVALLPLPTLVAGRVVTAGSSSMANGPVPNAAVTVVAVDPRGGRDARLFSPALSAFPLDGTTDEDGRFVISGLPKGQVLALSVEAPGIDPKESIPRIFAPRRSDVEIVLGPAGALDVRVSMTADFGPIDLGFANAWLRAWPRGADRTEDLGVLVPTVEVSERGHGAFESLPPGLYDISLHLTSPENPAALVSENVRVAPALGGDAQGGRSSLMALLGDLRVWRLEVEDGEGQPIAVQVEHRLPGQTTWLPATPLSADINHLGVISAWPALDLRVSAKGHVAQVLLAVDGDREVVLLLEGE